jgi:FkbM family methyltransferase
MRDALFRRLAAHYPTERIAESRMLAALWRTMFYAISPQAPFVMRTARYPLWAHPRKGTLTPAIIRRGEWEADETAFIASRLKPGGFFVDAGANFGHYALAAAGIVGAGGLVAAFEPHPATFELLRANAALQPDARIMCVPAGLASAEGAMPLTVDTANPGGHSYFRRAVRIDGGAVETPVYTLDGWLVREGLAERPLDVIKIDVQGFEAKFIAGGAQTIARHRPVVLCEVTPSAMSLAGDQPRALSRFVAIAGMGEIVGAFC